MYKDFLHGIAAGFILLTLFATVGLLAGCDDEYSEPDTLEYVITDSTDLTFYQQVYLGRQNVCLARAENGSYRASESCLRELDRSRLGRLVLKR